MRLGGREVGGRLRLGVREPWVYVGRCGGRQKTKTVGKTLC